VRVVVDREQDVVQLADRAEVVDRPVRAHNVLFPVNYDSHFYSSLTDDRLHHPEDYCKLIYYLPRLLTVLSGHI
jgi:hypothetical protein